VKRFVLLLGIALAGAACLPAGAQAAFGFSEFDVTFTDSAGLPATQAGSHPFAFTTSFEANVDGEEADGRLRELFLDLPPGLVVNPFAVPRCTADDFETLNEGVNDCSNAAAVGVAESASGEPETWTATPVFSLVSPASVPLRLGFRVAAAANVIVDFELSSESPYRLLATVGEIPEAVELFAAKLQLWGVPASPLHNDSRGWCAVMGGSCPTSVPQLPLLTLPASCEGPQETIYGAFSWGGDEDWGAAFLPGLGGCDALAFEPAADFQLATEAAGSLTGLDVSIDFEDQGLSNPGGLAESQVRDLVVALPGGTTAGPSLASASGSCAEADLEAEAPASAPGEGCPAVSTVGMAEAESSLLAGELLEGAVYRATPHQNLAGNAAMALYVVLKNADTGMIIKQPVSLAADAATDQLVAVAEEMPQLPFSHLRLHLDDGASGPLVSPPRCGDYEIEAELTPWADHGDYLVRSEFSLDSGPGDGPCPSGESTQSPSGDGAPVPAVAAAPAVIRPFVRPCPRGKRAIRRNGIRHCMKRCPKGKRKARRKGTVRCVKKRSCRRSKRMVRHQGKVRCVKRSRHHRYP
jgi:hypothetical protein